MKRLIASQEQSRRILRIKRWTQPSQHPLRPILGRAFGSHTNIEARGGNEHPVCVFEATDTDSVDPNCERLTEGSTRFFCRADEIGDHRAICFGDAVAHPAYSSGV